MAKPRRVGTCPKAFWELAVHRVKECDHDSELAKELGVHRRWLSTWRDQVEPAEKETGPPVHSRETTLRKEGSTLTRVLAEKTLEADCFTGALHTVQARRQRSEHSGEKASTPRSGS